MSSVSFIQPVLWKSIASLVFSEGKKKKMTLQKGRGLVIALPTHEFQLLITFDKGTPYLLQTHLVSPKPGLYKSNNTVLFNISTSPAPAQKCTASWYHLLPGEGAEQLPQPAGQGRGESTVLGSCWWKLPLTQALGTAAEPRLCCAHICSRHQWLSLDCQRCHSTAQGWIPQHPEQHLPGCSPVPSWDSVPKAQTGFGGTDISCAG